ncbi:MAG: precorrin-2 dehydrogenase/sirohydrochlorin ferrochelatase family protein [Syntrophomonadaceae bacterium]|jgi:precorrin-2 dehydrogenase/sirohydrochlorin ferrochelatase
MTHLFPVFLNLYHKNCLIIGGGKVAERKAGDLLLYDARIKVVSPYAGDQIRHWSEQGVLSWEARVFRESDLKDVFLVFLATDDRVLNKRIVELCREKQILVNAVDDPPNCDFYVPSLVRQKSLAIAISTEGKSPLFAKRLREELEQIITYEYGEFVDLLGKVREQIQAEVSDITERKRILTSLVYSDILELLKAGEKEKVRERIEQCMSYSQD